jgi:putative ABC transport system permease protein
MLFWIIVKTALKSLWASKMRSFLAMLGIIIGVAAVIAMLAIGAGAQQQVLERFTAMGTNLLIVRPSQNGTGGVKSGNAQTLVVDDCAALLKENPAITAVAPVVSGSVQAKYMGQNSRTSAMGTTITYLAARNFEVESGRAFTEAEAEGSARVALLGPTTATDLFADESPLDRMVKLNGINFKVIGVLKAKGDQGWFNPDDQVIIPYTTAMHEIFGLTYLREIDIQSAEHTNLDQLQADVTALLRRRHRIQPGEDEDFSIRNQADLLEAMSAATGTFKVLLASIAGISLLVGGIGIMNIMLVTVTERTREIGVRKAVGARNADIMKQFLVESMLMSGVGGLLGACMGISAAMLVSHFTTFTTIVQPDSIVISLSVSAAVGIFFGFYPAYRAAQLDPIEALRYE